ncbi:hypothetical protein [Actinokineospora terrae]|uniref:Uncharacterized protein n=1 Tax=Actinokineospora terrae TaxID=155974 RepID=A0A1H9VHT9_9PSEU|nr:hypothetical protein [Actinokineospora terrae]SES20803.1 hypothetical protein SAMN04487818_108352 [Actinokineospora terrae]
MGKRNNDNSDDKDQMFRFVDADARYHEGVARFEEDLRELGVHVENPDDPR